MGPRCEGYWSCWHHFTCELNQRVLMIVIDLISHSCMSCHFSTSYDFCPSFLLPQLQTAYFFPFRLPHNLLLLRQIHLFQIKRQIHTPKSINALSLSLSAVTHQRSSLFSLKMDPPTKLLVYAILEDQKNIPMLTPEFWIWTLPIIMHEYLWNVTRSLNREPRMKFFTIHKICRLSFTLVTSRLYKYNGNVQPNNHATYQVLGSCYFHLVTPRTRLDFPFHLSKQERTSKKKKKKKTH